MIINEEAELLNIAVAASHRRQGLGDKLMTHALSLAKSRGVKAVYLEVRESNTPARRLYEKYGYIALGVRKKLLCLSTRKRGSNAETIVI